MKPYTVVGLNPNDLFDFAGPRESRSTYWAHGHQAENPSPANFDGKVMVYFCDTELAAQQLASFLSSRFSGIYWMAAKNLNTYQSAPGPVKKAAFTDKGLMPTT